MLKPNLCITCAHLSYCTKAEKAKEKLKKLCNKLLEKQEIYLDIQYNIFKCIDYLEVKGGTPTILNLEYSNEGKAPPPPKKYRN